MSFTTSIKPVVFTSKRHTSAICIGVNYDGVKQVGSWKELAPGDFYVQLLSNGYWWTEGGEFTVYDAAQITITRVSDDKSYLENRIILLPTPGEFDLRLVSDDGLKILLEHYENQRHLWTALGIDYSRIWLDKQFESSTTTSASSTQPKLSNAVATTEPVVIHLESSTPSNPFTRFIERLRQLFTRQKL
ncbi:hypothetical protein [Microcystis phage Mvi-JY20]|uniref:Uncharacterized protein n=1 Tax=Microcystis phage Mvi-JY20 TaxID=3128146 RepID=A0AAX4QG85_9CAUD